MKQEPASTEEPVAWRHISKTAVLRRPEMWTVQTYPPATIVREAWEVQPLYTEPPRVESSTHALRVTNKMVGVAHEAYLEATSGDEYNVYSAWKAALEAALASTSAEPPVGDAALGTGALRAAVEVLREEHSATHDPADPRCETCLAIGAVAAAALSARPADGADDD